MCFSFEIFLSPSAALRATIEDRPSAFCHLNFATQHFFTGGNRGNRASYKIFLCSLTPHIISIFESAPWFIAASEYAHAVSHR